MRTSKYFFGKLFTTPPSVQKMRQRYEACCDRIQDSILIIEANMGTDERFSFDLNAAVAGIATCDLKVAGEAAKRYILIHEEYRCIIKMKSLDEKLNVKLYHCQPQQDCSRIWEKQGRQGGFQSIHIPSRHQADKMLQTHQLHKETYYSK